MSALAWLVIVVVGCGGAEPVPDETPGEAMAREHAHEAPGPTAATEPEPLLPVVEEQIEYAPGVRGWLARPRDGAPPRAGLIVIHEWWGLNDNVRAVNRRLAGEGYAALAVDLYRGQVATEPGAARPLMEAA